MTTRAARYRPTDEVEEGRKRDPLHVMKTKMVELGYLTQEEADRHPAEHKGASETTDDDFPEDVVAYLTKGVNFAMKSPLPDAHEAEQWVFREEN